MGDLGIIYDWFPSDPSPVVDFTNAPVGVGYSLQFSPTDNSAQIITVPLTDSSVAPLQQAFENTYLTLSGPNSAPAAQPLALPIIQNLYVSLVEMGAAFNTDLS